MAAPVYRTFATGTTATGTSFTCNKPSGVVAGDLMVAFMSTFEGANTDPHVISGGWTMLPGTSKIWDAGVATLSAWYRVAGGSEPSSYTASLGSSGSILGSLVIVATNGPGEVLSGNAVGVADTSADTTGAAPSIAPGEALLLIGQSYQGISGGYTYPASYTDMTGELGASNNKLRVCRRENYAGGSTGTVNGTYGSSKSDVIIHAAITLPAAAGPTFVPQIAIL